MEIDFLELLKFIENKKDGAFYENVISQIKMLESNPETEIEITIPIILIKEFVSIKKNLE